MSVLIPVASTGITLNEIPHKIAYYIEIANCKANCPGCHSPHLHTAGKLIDLQDLIVAADHALDMGANAIVIMGGTTNDLPQADLVDLINQCAHLAPTGLYSGRSDSEADLDLFRKTLLSWIKTGDYRPECGGLNKPTTNQRFYRKEYKYSVKNYEVVDVDIEIIDCTYEFRK